MAKSKQPDNAELETGAQLSFESSLAELQKIVADLEEGNVGLEESLKSFEAGVGLLRDCYALLAQAEQRIEILTGIDADGRPLTQPFDASATADQPRPTAGRRGAARENLSQTDADDSGSPETRRLF